ncbi:hypothetical protein Fmac_021835 [Flemingia macrophylla]|uniref:Glycoside hydrolase family 38 central domain-containing protein n=1 Tax=Flemingia macrophylla TaxID=520843 RepID=A0ABD1LXZ9_9FABA
MASPNPNQEKEGVVGRAMAMPKVVKKKVLDILRLAKEIAQDDPRKVIHSLKVGLSISMVSLFYYYQPLYDSFGLSAMWAVMTVVLVFEYTVGATLARGLNRTVATLGAGALGIGAHHIASLSGATAEPILIGAFVFVIAAIASFIRFFPKVMARYDYGMMIFILTFSLISVSGFRDEQVLKMAHQRLSAISIGGLACVVISIFVRPVWAGDEFHHSTANKLEILGDFLEAFVFEYFKISKEGKFEDNKGYSKDKSVLEGYKKVLNSKSSDEALVNFARWEPGHGKFKFRHPWNLYFRIGTFSRQCACRMEALHAHLSSDIQDGHIESLGKQTPLNGMLAAESSNHLLDTLFTQAARQLEYFKGNSALGPKTDSLAEALAIVQHHDTVTGTEKQHVVDDYAKRLLICYIKLQ